MCKPRKIKPASDGEAKAPADSSKDPVPAADPAAARNGKSSGDNNKDPAGKSGKSGKSKSQKSQKKKEGGAGSADGAGGPPVAKCVQGASAQVTSWVQRALNMGVLALRNEYKALSKWCPDGMTINAFKDNQAAGRNRYQDVPCQDARRVVLTWPGTPTDYIHANYVKTPHSENRFICAQGPLEGTVVEFWCMILQEEVETIVMLCNLIEMGKIKCHKYFPMEKGEAMQINPDISVTNTEIRPMCPEEPSVQLSILKVTFKKDGKEDSREVRHYQWLDWPDRGVPPCKLTSMELLSRIRGTTKPIVVHCSAGIGRTGTIVAIEYTLERLQYGLECVDMDKLLKELREQRPWSIQNDLQYLYIHRVLLFYFLDKYKERNAACLTPENIEKYKRFIEDYDKATA